MDPPTARLAAREAVLRMLALAASDPTSQRFGKASDPALLELASAAARYLAAEPSSSHVPLAPGEAPPAVLDLEPLAEALVAPRERLVADHDRVFGLVVSKECPPLETEYCPQTFSVYRSQHIADAAGFYLAFGVEPGRDVPERPDHIACELEFLAWLVSRERHALQEEGDERAERASVCRQAQRDFLSEHVAWWVPAFASALGTRARSFEPVAALQAALADALAAWVPLERTLLDVAPPTELARPLSEVAETDGACGGCAIAEERSVPGCGVSSAPPSV